MAILEARDGNVEKEQFYKGKAFGLRRTVEMVRELMVGAESIKDTHPEPQAQEPDELQRIRDALGETASVMCTFLERPEGYALRAVQVKWSEHIKTACADAGIELGE